MEEFCVFEVIQDEKQIEMESKMKSSKQNSILRSEVGFGLVEVMIAAAMISIIALGIGTLIDDMMRAQRKTNVAGMLNSMKERIVAAVQNGQSWQFTVADATAATGNPQMTCLQGGAACAPAVANPLNLKGADNMEVYYSATAGRGFTLDGTTCTTYPSDVCLFRWVLTWTGTCPTPAACMHPTIRVRGTLEYNPGPLTLAGGFNSLNYAIDIQRGSAAIRNDAVMIAGKISGPIGEGTGCEVGWKKRVLNTTVSDPGNNVLALTNDQVQLRAGTYNCRIQAPSFKSGGNRIKLKRVAGTSFTEVESGSSLAARNGGSANLIIETTLILDQPTTFQVDHRCEFLPTSTGFGTALDSFQLGVPTKDGSGSYNGVTYTTVSCARTS